MILLYVCLIIILSTISISIIKYPLEDIKIGKYHCSAIKFKIFIIIILSSITIGIYSTIGNYDKLDKYIFYKNNMPTINHILSNIKSDAKMEKILQSKVNDNPSDDSLKLLLAKQSLISGKIENAKEIINTIEYKNNISTNQAQSYIETRFFINKKLNNQEVALAKNILFERPDNKVILAILAKDQYLKKNYKQANILLNKLNKLLIDNSKEKEAVRILIQSANINI
jgi:hypothetical protein